MKPNQLPEAKSEKKGGGTAGSSGDDAEGDKENSPNLELAASPGGGAARPNASLSAGSNAGPSERAGASAAASGDAPTARPDSEEPATKDALGPSKGLVPLPKAGGLASSGSSLFADMPKLPGTLGSGAVAGRRAGLAPLGGVGGMAGGFGSLTAASLGLPDDDEDDDDDAPVFSSQAAKKPAADSAPAKPAHLEVKVDSPASAPSSKDSGVDRFLGIGVKSPASSALGDKNNAKKETPKEDSFEFEEEVVEEEDIPDYADDFEDDFEDEDDDNVSLPLPSSNTKDKDKDGANGQVGAAAGGDEECREGETQAEKEERLRLKGDDVDLNRVEETELEKYKRLMEEEFEKNAIKPGDPNWKHDVQVDFGSADEDCGWDEEDEEAEEEEDVF